MNYLSEAIELDHYHTLTYISFCIEYWSGEENKILEGTLTNHFMMDQKKM